MTPLLGIHHVAVTCADYDRSRDFYVRVLGLAVKAEHHRAARDSWKLDLALPDGGQLELFSFPAPPPRPSRPEAQGLRHLAFRVARLEPMIERLAAAGVAFVITVPGADDVMLGDQSLSFHDVLATRRTLGLRPAAEFETWLRSVGMVDDSGKLTPFDLERSVLRSLTSAETS